MTLIGYITLVSLFFIVSIIQASFLPSFAIARVVPDLLFVVFFILIFFQYKYAFGDGFFVALIGGFFIDVTSRTYFGVAIVSLLLVYFLEKVIVRFLREGQDVYPVYYFTPLFFACFFAYYGILYAMSFIFPFSAAVGIATVASALYSGVFALAGYFIYKKFIRQENNENQLKLL